MISTTVTTKTTKVTRTIIIDENEISNILLRFYGIRNGEVDFDIRQGSFLAGCTLTQTDITVEESA